MADPRFYEDPRIVVKVPVVFWGHKYPGDEKHGSDFELRFHPKTKHWGFTPAPKGSALYGYGYFMSWINETFKPDYKNFKEGEERPALGVELILKDGNPHYIKWGLTRKLEFSEETKNELKEWKYWEGKPEPDVDRYYIPVDLDNDSWQCDDASIKTRGPDF